MPDFSNIRYSSCNPKVFVFLEDVNKDLFIKVDEQVVKMRNNDLYYDSLDDVAKKDIINQVIRYINLIIKFIKLCCLFTNKKTKDELIRLTLSRLRSSMPKSIKDAVKMSLVKKESDMKIDRLKNLVKKISKDHKLGLADANKIASTVIWHLEDVFNKELN